MSSGLGGAALQRAGGQDQKRLWSAGEGQGCCVEVRKASLVRMVSEMNGEQVTGMENWLAEGVRFQGVSLDGSHLQKWGALIKGGNTSFEVKV
jgi:hypothetical protein